MAPEKKGGSKPDEIGKKKKDQKRTGFSTIKINLSRPRLKNKVKGAIVYPAQRERPGICGGMKNMKNGGATRPKTKNSSSYESARSCLRNGKKMACNI